MKKNLQKISTFFPKFSQKLNSFCACRFPWPKIWRAGLGPTLPYTLCKAGVPCSPQTLLFFPTRNVHFTASLILFFHSFTEAASYPPLLEAGSYDSVCRRTPFQQDVFGHRALAWLETEVAREMQHLQYLAIHFTQCSLIAWSQTEHCVCQVNSSPRGRRCRILGQSRGDTATVIDVCRKV